MARSDDGTGSRDSEGESNDEELSKLLREVARTDDKRPDEVAPAGARIGRFVIRGILGRGGMGVVYRALDPALGRAVALKVLRTEREADPARRSRFLREARSAAAVVHPNVATVYEVGDSSDVLFIAMEIVGGETLRERLTSAKSLSAPEVIEIAEGILRGLVAAHAQGIVHRDLKPENVMIDREHGVLKILDFGLAKLHDARALDREMLEHLPTDGLSTAEGHILGTPAYMSPEQAAGKPLDHRSDLFSLGSMLYEALTGERPFAGETTVETMAAVIRDTPAPIREVKPDVPTGLASLVTQCLAKKAANRPESAAVALASLHEAGEPPHATGPAQFSPRPPPRRRTTPILGGIAVVACGIGLVALGDRSNGAPKLPASASVSVSLSTSAPRRLSQIEPPETTNELAREKCRVAMHAYADANYEEAARALDAALEAVPGLASAHLQKAYLAFSRWDGLDERARVSFRSAIALRQSLSPRDSALLDAMTPAFSDPPNWQDATKRFDALVTAYPLDAQAYEGLGVSLLKDEDIERAESAFLTVKRIDPSAASARVILSQLAEERAEFGEAAKSLRECIAASTSALGCRIQLAALLSATGQCKDADNVARDAYVLDPSSRSAAWARARAAAALGAKRAVVSELIEPQRNLIASGDRPAFEARDWFALAMREGDFTSALRALDLVDQLPNRSSVELNRAAFLRARTLWEMGEPRKSAASARAFLDRAAARVVPERIGLDETGRLLGYAKAGGSIGPEDFLGRREAWLQELHLRPSSRSWQKGDVGWVSWLYAYGTPDDPTAQDAAQAFAALDPSTRIVKFAMAGSRPEDIVSQESAFGALLLGAGRLDEAEVRLGYAAHACLVVPEVHALYLLGNVYAQKNDHDRACRTYAEVEVLWGHARPRSITAEAARAAASRIDCRPSR